MNESFIFMMAFILFVEIAIPWNFAIVSDNNEDISLTENFLKIIKFEKFEIFLKIFVYALALALFPFNNVNYFSAIIIMLMVIANATVFKKY